MQLRPALLLPAAARTDRATNCPATRRVRHQIKYVCRERPSCAPLPPMRPVLSSRILACPCPPLPSLPRRPPRQRLFLSDDAVFLRSAHVG